MGCIASKDIVCDAAALQRHYQDASIAAASRWTTYAFTYNYDWNRAHVAYPHYAFEAPKRCLSWHCSRLQFSPGCKIKMKRELYEALCE